MDEECKPVASAQIYISRGGDFWNVEAMGEGEEPSIVLELMQFIEKSFTDGRIHLVRADAEVNSERDVQYDMMRHVGYARFAVKDEPGKRIERASSVNQVAYLGLPQAKTEK